MASGTLAIVFSLALGKFKAHLTDSQKTDFQFVTLKDLEKSLGKIQARQSSQKQLRAMGRLSRFLEVMDQFDQIIKDLVNASEYVAFVWVCFPPMGSKHFRLPKLTDAYLMPNEGAYETTS
jgi:hypothetical protein